MNNSVKKLNLTINGRDEFLNGYDIYSFDCKVDDLKKGKCMINERAFLSDHYVTISCDIRSLNIDSNTKKVLYTIMGLDYDEGKERLLSVCVADENESISDILRNLLTIMKITKVNFLVIADICNIASEWKFNPAQYFKSLLEVYPKLKIFNSLYLGEQNLCACMPYNCALNFRSCVRHNIRYARSEQLVENVMSDLMVYTIGLSNTSLVQSFEMDMSKLALEDHRVRRAIYGAFFADIDILYRYLNSNAFLTQNGYAEIAYLFLVYKSLKEPKYRQFDQVRSALRD